MIILQFFKGIVFQQCIHYLIVFETRVFSSLHIKHLIRKNLGHLVQRNLGPTCLLKISKCFRFGFLRSLEREVIQVDADVNKAEWIIHDIY